METAAPTTSKKQNQKEQERKRTRKKKYADHRLEPSREGPLSKSAFPQTRKGAG
jgi:hypothetical protein